MGAWEYVCTDRHIPERSDNSTRNLSGVLLAYVSIQENRRISRPIATQWMLIQGPLDSVGLENACCITRAEKMPCIVGEPCFYFRFRAISICHCQRNEWMLPFHWINMTFRNSSHNGIGKTSSLAGMSKWGKQLMHLVSKPQRKSICANTISVISGFIHGKDQRQMSALPRPPFSKAW